LVFYGWKFDRQEMTKDLESMKEVGISNLIFLEVGIGVPRGPVDFMSEQWQDLYVHAVREAERLGNKNIAWVQARDGAAVVGPG
jgi:hypothetical protein